MDYAIVMAKLIIKGKPFGMHGFMVQLRDTDTHEPLAGKFQNSESFFLVNVIYSYEHFIRIAKL